jgi:hypothetical protein
MALDVQQFTVDSHPDQQLIAFTAEPGSPSAEALQFLLQMGVPSPAAPRPSGSGTKA